jgi:flagellar hook-basal body complex protein FliE
MEVRLTPAMLSTLQERLRTGAPSVTAAAGSPAAGSGGSFAAALGDALKDVSQAQKTSTEMQRRFQAGVEGVSLEETMIAMQKAQIGFQAALAVRNRLVSAYTDVMNMQV